MSAEGRVLMADDEETFLESTAELLRRAGFDCQTARDGGTATELLTAGEYDLLVADIRMPGNVDLGLLRQAARVRPHLPVLLVTGYPSLDTAIRAIDLSVVAYLVKPIDFDQFLLRVRAAISGARVTRALHEVRGRLASWQSDLVAVAQSGVVPGPAPAPTPSTFEGFLASTSRTIMDCLADLRHVAEALAGHPTESEPCHLLNCPRLRQFREAAVEAIAVLEQTRGAFKSRQLGDLRRRLEDLVRDEGGHRP